MAWYGSALSAPGTLGRMCFDSLAHEVAVGSLVRLDVVWTSNSATRAETTEAPGRYLNRAVHESNLSL